MSLSADNGRLRKQLAEDELRNKEVRDAFYRQRDELIDMERELAETKAKLKKLAERYKYCRHGSVDCFCTVEARAIIFAIHADAKEGE